MRLERRRWNGADPRSLAAELRSADEPDFTVATAVGETIETVRVGGDAALIELGERFDGNRARSLRVESGEIAAATAAIPDELRSAIERGAANIRAVAEAQIPRPATPCWPRASGSRSPRCRSAPRAIYAPGGRAPYPSSVLMGVIPAIAAGVGRVVVASPPGPDGRPHQRVLAAAAIAGADEVYAMGGAQAIAALAYGTESVEPVDVIAGPGSPWVQEAKLQVSRVVGIDGYAGPSELVAISTPTRGPSGSRSTSARRPSTATTACSSSPRPTPACSSGSPRRSIASLPRARRPRGEDRLVEVRTSTPRSRSPRRSRPSTSSSTAPTPPIARRRSRLPAASSSGSGRRRVRRLRRRLQPRPADRRRRQVHRPARPGDLQAADQPGRARAAAAAALAPSSTRSRARRDSRCTASLRRPGPRADPAAGGINIHEQRVARTAGSNVGRARRRSRSRSTSTAGRSPPPPASASSTTCSTCSGVTAGSASRSGRGRPRDRLPPHRRGRRDRLRPGARRGARRPRRDPPLRARRAADGRVARGLLDRHLGAPLLPLRSDLPPVTIAGFEAELTESSSGPWRRTRS